MYFGEKTTKQQMFYYLFNHRRHTDAVSRLQRGSQGLFTLSATKSEFFLLFQHPKNTIKGFKWLAEHFTTIAMALHTLHLWSKTCTTEYYLKICFLEKE